MIPLLIGISVITFSVIHLSPGKPVELMTDMQAKISAEAKQRLTQLYGLDKPWYVQYFNWLTRLVKLDFGNSFRDNRPVIKKIFERLPATLLLNFCSLFIIFFAALPIGIYSALKRNSIFDKSLTVFVFLGYSTPGFWLAILLMTLFGIKLGWLPISGLRSINYDILNSFGKIADIAKHLVLPVIVSAFGGLAGLSRYTRNSMLDAVTTDYVKYARAKGLPEGKVIYKHALKNALIPVVTILGLSLPALIGGSFIFETIFAYPGMGRLGYEAIMSRDYPVVMAVGTIAAFLTLVGNLLADIAYAYVDPRIRYNK
jgi:peptide/nickel transport system permease protein